MIEYALLALIAAFNCCH